MIEKYLANRVLESLQDYVAQVTDDEDSNNITLETNPINDLGLDSADGVSWACDLAGIGINIPNEINPFLDSKTQNPISLKNLVKKLLPLQNQEENNDE